MKYAEIILPIAGDCYTFSVGGDLEDRLSEGSAVAVQFGARKIVGGIVRRVHGVKPPFRTKPVLRLLFPEVMVLPGQMRLWEWMAEYYMCTLGEVMRAALPAMLKPSGFTAGEFEGDGFRARRVGFVSLGAAVTGEAEFNEVCERLRRRAPRQYDTMVEISSHGGVPVPRGKLRADGAALAALRKKGLIVVEEREIVGEISDGGVGFALPVLSPAQQKALDGLRAATRRYSTALLFGVPSSGKSEVYFHAIAGTLARGRDVLLLLPEISLTTQFVERVRRVFGDRIVLYHSGLSDRRRAEAYIALARSRGGSLIVGTRSAVFLPMPRPGLVVVDEEQDPSYKQQDPAPRYNARDTAIVLAGLHDAHVILAGATPSLETWANAAAGKYGLVELSERWGGTLPPEVIISDTIRAAKRGERRSHFNKDLLDRIEAALGRGEQTILFQNRRGIAPFVECADCGHVPRCGHCGIPMTVHRGGLRCHYCGAAAAMPTVCPACGGRDGGGDLTGMAKPTVTSRSGGNSTRGLTIRGFGTEKIEEELARLFPEARVARLDRDSASSERAYRRIIGDFEAGETDILVGTQMVTKGLDFVGVSLVGVLNADNLVNHPDFRASERAYSLLAQVAGRAGRHRNASSTEVRLSATGRRGKTEGDSDGGELAGETYPSPSSRSVSNGTAHIDGIRGRGEVVIQTASPGSRLIAQAAAGDYCAMAADLLSERALYGYPPYTRLVSVTLRHAARETLNAAAARFADLLRPSFGDRMLGPQPPVTEKIKGEYALVFLLKVERSRSLSAARETIGGAVRTLVADHALRGTSATINVDPQ